MSKRNRQPKNTRVYYEIRKVISSKVCRKCNLEKDISEFYLQKNISGTHYPFGECKECIKECRRNKYNSGDGKKKYRQSVRSLLLEKKYGISKEQFDIMLKQQSGLCCICGNKEKDRELSVDHDHKTGAIRGLLCRHCNFAIGILKDDVGIMSRMIMYLQKSVNQSQHSPQSQINFTHQARGMIWQKETGIAPSEPMR
jgi:hypothetical protein